MIHENDSKVRLPDQTNRFLSILNAHLAQIRQSRTDQARLAFLTQSITLSVDRQRVTVMQQTIRDPRRQNLVSEYRSPFRYPLIRRDQHAIMLAMTIHQLKKQPARDTLER